MGVKGLWAETGVNGMQVVGFGADSIEFDVQIYGERDLDFLASVVENILKKFMRRYGLRVVGYDRQYCREGTCFRKRGLKLSNNDTLTYVVMSMPNYAYISQVEVVRK